MTAELIERLEKAEGPSFALDCAIFEAVLPTEWFGSRVESWFQDGGMYGCNTADGYRHLGCLKAPAYTASIDAAISLVPEGHACQVRRNCSADGDVVYCNGQVWPFSGPREEEAPHFWANAPENCPAIALCIAALKARTAANASSE